MIYGARLRQAREFSRLTQRAVQVEIGVSQSRWSSAESDAYELPEIALSKFADLTGFPTSFFERPPRIELSGDPLHFRSRSTVSKAELRQAERAGEIVFEAAVYLQSQLDGPRLVLPTEPASETTRLTGLLRQALGLTPTEPARDLLHLLEHAGVTVVAVPAAATRKDAFSVWLDDRPFVALLETEAGDRQTWSLAHEMGHLLLHRGVGASRALESEADDFAAELLLPPAALSKEMPQHPTLQDFAMLKRRWRVSIAALIRAARRLERIDDDRYHSLFRQMSARGERLREKAAIAPSKPRGLRAMAEVLYGPTPVRGLADVMHWTLEFAEDVMVRHATAEELPFRRERADTVVSLDSRRKGTR
ncbi:XRE family transcriptional regulator [Serinicoccus hydrothermalis]|uniref:XRE family transcriptional regulator n=1 Tax=Serinicoccus hydrothermalis TaxID=1758689 RepID=UPI00082BB4DC|nr:XRE family transcriptional regulator [Serinicoccus hydrothermalis]